MLQSSLCAGHWFILSAFQTHCPYLLEIVGQREGRGERITIDWCGDTDSFWLLMAGRYIWIAIHNGNKMDWRKHRLNTETRHKALGSSSRPVEQMKQGQDSFCFWWLDDILGFPNIMKIIWTEVKYLIQKQDARL